MTDKDIIKALECCFMEQQCNNCPLYKEHSVDCLDKEHSVDCLDTVLENAHALITRQQAEIDEFMKETAVTTLIDDTVVYTPTLEDYNKFKKKFKSEAVKEVFEKLNKKAKVGKIIDKNFPFIIRVVTLHDINELKKEMVGDDNA